MKRAGVGYRGKREEEKGKAKATKVKGKAKVQEKASLKAKVSKAKTIKALAKTPRGRKRYALEVIAGGAGG